MLDEKRREEVQKLVSLVYTLAEVCTEYCCRRKCILGTDPITQAERSSQNTRVNSLSRGATLEIC